MNFRENAMAILNYKPYEKLPVVSFGYWNETVEKWANQGYIAREDAESYIRMGDNSDGDKSIMKALGFDFNWNSCMGANVLLQPFFEIKELETFSDGSRIIRNHIGLIVKDKPGTVSIPAQIGTTLTDRKSWEELFLPRFRMSDDRVNLDLFKNLPEPEKRRYPIGIHLGSLIGNMRDLLGVEHLSYLYADDEELFTEIINTMCGLCYDCAKLILETGAQFDYAHFWEDICFKNGPLVSPYVLDEYVGPWYRKIAQLVNSYGVNIVSVDCDGLIDSLIPIWLKNGVNTMFPIEVGTWNASIAPWRKQYGKELRGVGGMNKTVFAKDRAAIDAEIERLKPLIELGGYIPCPDHRIDPTAEFELVQYYCDKMQNLKKS